MTLSQTDPAALQSPEEEAALGMRQQLLLRKGAALEELNKRIARLAIALGLKLDTDVGLREAMEPVAPMPHQHAFQAELRGLLTLRFQMEKQLVDEVGGDALHLLVSEVELHMESRGFKHGADGIHESQLFDEKI